MCVLDHPLYGQVLRRGIPAARRRAIYREQAAHLAALGARRREDALRLASWRRAAGLPVGLDTLLPAARMARHVRDYPTVVDLLASGPGSGTPPWRSGCCAARPTTTPAAGQTAEECLRAAERLAERDEDVLTVAMERTQNLYWGLGDTARTLEVNTRAAARLDESGRRVLRVNEAAYLLYSGRVPDALRLLADAETIAVPRLRMWAQLQRSLALSYTGRSGEAVELARVVHEELTAAEGEQRPGRPSSHASGPAIYRVAALTDAGRTQEAREVGRAAFSRAVGARAPAPQIWLAAHLGRCELIAGHLGPAHDWFTEALGLARGQQASAGNGLRGRRTGRGARPDGPRRPGAHRTLHDGLVPGGGAPARRPADAAARHRLADGGRRRDRGGATGARRSGRAGPCGGYVLLRELASGRRRAARSRRRGARPAGGTGRGRRQPPRRPQGTARRGTRRRRPPAAARRGAAVRGTGRGHDGSRGRHRGVCRRRAGR